MGVCTKERKSLGGESGGQKHGGRKDPESGEVAQARGRPARDRGLALPRTFQREKGDVMLMMFITDVYG